MALRRKHPCGAAASRAAGRLKPILQELCMTLEIKTATIAPVRHTYANIARRFGKSRPPAIRKPLMMRRPPPIFTIGRCGSRKKS